MSSIPDDVAALLVRLLLAGPIGYVGLWIAVNPAGVLRLRDDLGRGIGRFENHLRWPHWRQPFPRWQPVPDTPGAQAFVRVIGATLVVFSLLLIAGAAN